MKQPRKLVPGTEPVMKVELEKPFTITTTNAFGREITSEEDFSRCLKEKIGHPVFGPIAVRGIKAGECVEIFIKKIQLNNRAYQCISKSTGVLKNDFSTRNYKIHKIVDGKISFGKSKIVVRPSIGFLSTMPTEEIGCGRATKYGGNLDFNLLQEGSSLILPTVFDRGLLFAGDLHALQGNGEICGMALECGGEVTLEVSKSKIKTDYPLITKKQGRRKEVIIVGSGYTVEEASQNAVRNAIDYVKKLTGMKKEDAYLYLSGVADLIFGNFTGTVKTCGVHIKQRNILELSDKIKKK